MKWSWPILRVGGIGIYVHVTFVLLPIWVGLSSYAERGSWGDVGAGVAFILVLFGVVVLHELAHALTARRFGIRTRDITLLPIGGVARMERMPEDPRQELQVALAGPAINVAIAVSLYALLSITEDIGNLALLGTGEIGFLGSLMWVNVALAIFNMVPAFPMDGGRVLRALLAMRFSYVRATATAAGIGQAIALLFAFVGLCSILFGHFGPVSNPFLLFIALFVWVGARQEAGSVRMKSALAGVSLSSVMTTDLRALEPGDSLLSAAKQILAGCQRDFPVLENGSLVGLLTYDRLVDGLAQKGAAASVSEFMVRHFPTIDPEATIEAALSGLRAGGERLLLVARDGKLFGLISRDNVAQFLTIRTALNGSAVLEPPSSEPEQRYAA